MAVERKLKHLEFIQGVINRLGVNSFRVKGWSVVLVSALFVLAAREGIGLSVIALIPLLCFWDWMVTTSGRSACSEHCMTMSASGTNPI